MLLKSEKEQRQYWTRGYEVNEELHLKSPHLKTILEIFGNELNNDWFKKIIELLVALEIPGEESEFLFQEIIWKIKEKATEYLK